MKTALLLFTILFTFLNTFAQEDSSYEFKKNDIIVSGTFNYSNKNSKSFTNGEEKHSSKINSFTIVPEIGYFLSNNLLIGVRAGYITSTSKNKNSNTYNYKERSYKTSIIGRYYFTSKKRISFFVESEVGYQNTTFKSGSNDANILNSNNNKQENYSATLTSGINIFITNSLALTARIGKIGYTKSKFRNKHSINENSYKNESGEFITSLNMDNFYFGILYRI
ncbi:hypothetical protein [Aquimarina longa]|uniref:hypothetical protein n=1 Tax=Aquimarina longa TaxID=1080221 RepID=UPI000783D383|nr:hypothetical protein [Aquimarina longa]